MVLPTRLKITNRLQQFPTKNEQLTLTHGWPVALANQLNARQSRRHHRTTTNEPAIVGRAHDHHQRADALPLRSCSENDNSGQHQHRRCGTLGKKVQPPGYVARSALKAKSRSSSIFSHRELMAPVLPLLPTVQFQGTCNVFVIAVLWFNVLQPHTCYRKNETPSVNLLNKCTTVFLEVQLYPISALIFPF